MSHHPVEPGERVVVTGLTLGSEKDGFINDWLPVCIWHGTVIDTKKMSTKFFAIDMATVWKNKGIISTMFCNALMRQHLGNNDHGVQESSKGFVHLAREGEGWSLMAEDDQSYCQQQSHPSLDMRNTNHSKIFSYIEVRHYVTLYLLCSNSRLLWEWPIWYAHTNINRGPSLPPFPLSPICNKNCQFSIPLQTWTLNRAFVPWTILVI